MFKLIKKIKSVSGQSLAEFAVVTAMMGTMATVAAPKFSGVGEGAKEKKSMSTIDNIVKAANNFYNTAVADDPLREPSPKPSASNGRRTCSRSCSSPRRPEPPGRSSRRRTSAPRPP